ncbi:hypothetical protein [Rhizobium sp. FKY42]|uniref:hypothetical protein n=1 Tax=Rhizobium sp. FKY42 TaxID=2562310 RepID=UPI0010C03646|nr:hypothetical protein [Rhizobium sp. FKY42]
MPNYDSNFIEKINSQIALLRQERLDFIEDYFEKNEHGFVFAALARLADFDGAIKSLEDAMQDASMANRKNSTD